MQETRTAGIAANHLKDNGFEVTASIGKTGVVGILRNGDGPTVMLRADMDALPIKEATGLSYASTVTATGPDGKTTPVAHSCGHDMHVACLMGAASLFAKSRDSWHGTLMAVFQPGEETAQGAQAMIDDGLFKRFPEARCRAWPACDEFAIRAPRLAQGSCNFLCRQPADSNVRTWRAWLDARGKH